MPLAEKIGKNKYLIAVRDGFLLSMPLLIVGSFFLLIANFPIPGWSDFWARFFGENWTSYFSKPTDATFTIMAILAVIGIGYSFAEQMNVDKLFGAAIAMVCWFLIMPYEIISGDTTVTGIPLGWVGSKGIFVGIIVAFLSVHILSLIHILHPSSFAVSFRAPLRILAQREQGLDSLRISNKTLPISVGITV